MLHVAAIKGVLADEAEYESGISRIALSLQARLEGMHVRRADRVIATSLYSAGQIAKFYGVDRSRIRVVPELIDLEVWERGLRAAPIEPGRPRVGKAVFGEGSHRSCPRNIGRVALGEVVRGGEGRSTAGRFEFADERGCRGADGTIIGLQTVEQRGRRGCALQLHERRDNGRNDALIAVVEHCRQPRQGKLGLKSA